MQNNNIDFELDLFIQNLFHEVQSLVYSDDNGDSKENKFTEYVMDILADAGETEGVRLCHYIKENKFENIQFKINGYALEEGYENIDIFISSYKDTNEFYKITKAEFEKLIKWSSGFINAALKGFLDDIEPSIEAYGLASLLTKERKKIIRINVFVLSNGDIPYDPPSDFKLINMEEVLINFKIWDIERLHRLSLSSGNREPIEIDFEETLGETIPCLEMPSKNDLYECYLAIVPGTVLSVLYRNYGVRLLESNVRAFLQQTGKVNQGIRDTIRFNPHMFLPYNNGLATTAQAVKTKITDKGQLVITSVKDFQIVNGGQTTASLFHTAKKYKEANISEVFVQMKLTVIKDEIKKDETVPFISRYANSQNKVSELDLTSNNPLLQRLEELSRTTFAIDLNDRNKQTVWFFERVKGQYKEALNKEPTVSKQNAFKLKYPKNQIIIKSDVAKYINLWELKPFHVSKGSQKNYTIFLREIEKKFKKNKANRIFWIDIVANAILFRATDKLFGRKNSDPIGDTNIKSHTVAYTLSYFHHITDNKLNLGSIWDNQNVATELQVELKKLLIFVYHFFTGLDVALISEAAKSEKNWTLLKEKINYPLDLNVVNKYLITEADYKSRYETIVDDVAESERYNTLEKITSLGLRFWDGLCIFMLRTDYLSEIQHNYITTIRKKIKTNGNFTDFEIKRGGIIIDVLVKNNVDFDKVKALSRFEEADLSMPSTIYNRLKLIDSSTWNRIIALGEQTGKLSFQEVSVIKTVILKLKKHESIDLRRLQIVNNSLEKVKKYGLNI
ncbi:AIPR family protein [Lentimicrobium sp. L6]|uniref:AIPR family protein n=1 Tax=Lentimicrobium sp. L6 TaxID=2735916 RepID=UPI001553E944|nr:AIPR family protein [Lentimicrobium sp. L6]NPD85365.1 AIPR family protein [Lentimicrobium sp. L6]